MTIKDLFITPLFIILILFLAYLFRPWITDDINRKYYIPALTLKLLGALALGAIYQFYYGGGDTFTYFNLGSKYIWEAFKDSPLIGIKLIFAGKDYSPDTFQYASRIYTYGDMASYFIVRIAAVFDILTYHTYSATAALFAAFSFSGVWALFLTLYRMQPKLHLQFAIATLFIPSMFFWGSGLLKDSITISALGWATFSIYSIFFERRRIVLSAIFLFVALYVLYVVKIYILMCYLPGVFLWIFISRLRNFRNIIIKIMIAPFLLLMTGFAGYYAVREVGRENPRYNLEGLSHTAEETAKWINYVSEREGGSAYTLGDFDYSPVGMLKKLPFAIWVTLYRPYFWESHNIVMLLSALESFLLLLLTLYTIYLVGILRIFRLITTHSELLFFFFFAIVFSFAVGISTYNFGSLVRYKIPMLPFFVAALFMLIHYAKSEKKFLRLESTEY